MTENNHKPYIFKTVKDIFDFANHDNIERLISFLYHNLSPTKNYDTTPESLIWYDNNTTLNTPSTNPQTDELISVPTHQTYKIVTISDFFKVITPNNYLRFFDDLKNFMHNIVILRYNLPNNELFLVSEYNWTDDGVVITNLDLKVKE